MRRWNYGLEEDLEEGSDGCCHFGKAHLPSLDVYGAMAFRESLHPELVLLDVEGRRGNTVFEPLARAIVEHLVADRQMAGEHAGAALQLLTQHLDSAKRVEHDDDVLQTAQAKQEKKDSRKKLASNLSLPNLFRAATQQEDEKEEPSRPASPASIAAWKSTGRAAPSSRCRVDGVEVDERAVKLISTQVNRHQGRRFGRRRRGGGRPGPH